MLLANDARKIAEESIKNHTTKELKDIDYEIHRCCEMGLTKYSYVGNISNVAMKELQRYGYNITIGYQYNEPYVIIEW